MQIAITGRANHPDLKNTLEHLTHFLQTKNIGYFLDQTYHDLLSPKRTWKAIDYHHIDFIIVVGGDGSFLQAARNLAHYNLPIVGINRGRKGFLADLSPQHLIEELNAILDGHCIEESRFLLQATLIRDNQRIQSGLALNDVVFYSGHLARMIEFELFINDIFVYKQYSDGLISATPTGSTAYALSAGGPIIHPSLEAITLVPMHPHTLSSRPLVISSDSSLRLHLMPDNPRDARCSLDGQEHFDVLPNDTLIIKKHHITCRLIHPTQYEYYNRLRSKLGWANSC